MDFEKTTWAVNRLRAHPGSATLPLPPRCRCHNAELFQDSNIWIDGTDDCVCDWCTLGDIDFLFCSNTKMWFTQRVMLIHEIQLWSNNPTLTRVVCARVRYTCSCCTRMLHTDAKQHFCDTACALGVLSWWWTEISWTRLKTWISSLFLEFVTIFKHALRGPSRFITCRFGCQSWQPLRSAHNLPAALVWSSRGLGANYPQVSECFFVIFANAMTSL